MAPADERRAPRRLTPEERRAEKVARQAELLILRPGPISAGGAVRERLLDLRVATQADVDRANDEVQAGLSRRRQAQERLRSIELALTGTRIFAGTRVRKRKRELPATGVAPAMTDRADPERTTLVGPSLRAAALAVLRAADGDELRVDDLVRVLEGQGHQIRGRASRTVSDALRPLVRAGRVERLQRGWYRAVP